MKTGFGGGRTGAYDPNDWVGAPRGLRGQQRLGAGIFSGRNAEPANDILGALLGENNIWEAQEGIGDVAGGPGMEDERMFKKLWGKTVNNPKLIGAPQPVLIKEWEKQKKIYLDWKYGT